MRCAISYVKRKTANGKFNTHSLKIIWQNQLILGDLSNLSLVCSGVVESFDSSGNAANDSVESGSSFGGLRVGDVALQATLLEDLQNHIIYIHGIDARQLPSFRARSLRREWRPLH